MRARPCRNASNKRAFSLIELLVVVAIIAIIIALTTMSIGSTSGSAKLTTAGNMVVDIINQARQHARSQNTLTMIAAINSGTDAGRVMSSFAYSIANNTWTQIDRWRTLSEGISIVDLDNSQFFVEADASAPEFKRGGATVTCRVATFLPDGRLKTVTSQSPVVVLQASQGSADNEYKIIINPATGMPIVRRP